ncbi:dehydrogenase [Paenibacillus swuensis]|uniref:Dehydrogenase n=1 Tax=Paenibacillus swuensis TaxID=1178515 RepID=A0A172TDW2_9BACL|nr:dehydrogenase [Paenibacillus swuensis]ANE45136.1 dehydrogenase [Paenibacillus swuensis]
MQQHNEKHKATLPTARKIRRACNKELYRAVKRLKKYIPEAKLAEGEDLYFKKVMLNLVWVHENSSNRKLLADWWDENVCPELSALWEVDPAPLSRAFREAFGG